MGAPDFCGHQALCLMQAGVLARILVGCKLGNLQVASDSHRFHRRFAMDAMKNELSHFVKFRDMVASNVAQSGCIKCCPVCWLIG